MVGNVDDDGASGIMQSRSGDGILDRFDRLAATIEDATAELADGGGYGGGERGGGESVMSPFDEEELPTRHVEPFTKGFGEDYDDNVSSLPAATLLGDDDGAATPEEEGGAFEEEDAEGYQYQRSVSCRNVMIIAILIAFVGMVAAIGTAVGFAMTKANPADAGGGGGGGEGAASGGVGDANSSSAAPSAAPTNAAPCVPIEFGIIFDQYPDEYGWMLVEGSEYDPNNDDTDSYVVVWESKYYDPLVYSSRADTFEECVPPGNYTFVFVDSEGDGICCYHGEGRYVLSTMGVVIAIGGTMDAEEEHVSFALPYVEPDPIDKDGDGRDDRLGWLLPYGTTNDTMTDGVDCENFRFVLRTNEYGVETSWELFEGHDASSGKLIADGGPYGSEHTHVVDYCLASPGEYVLYVYDYDGDGLCCDGGDGSFTVKSGDIVIVDNDGRFGDVNTTRFVLPADGSVSFVDFATLSPTESTVSPSVAPSSTPVVTISPVVGPSGMSLPTEFISRFTASPTVPPTPKPTLAPAKPDKLDTLEEDKESTPFPTLSSLA
jgi:hypothetical protein